jgi:hypothetical protein
VTTLWAALASRSLPPFPQRRQDEKIADGAHAARRHALRAALAISAALAFCHPGMLLCFRKESMCYTVGYFGVMCKSQITGRSIVYAFHSCFSIVCLYRCLSHCR